MKRCVGRFPAENLDQKLVVKTMKIRMKRVLRQVLHKDDFKFYKNNFMIVFTHQNRVGKKPSRATSGSFPGAFYTDEDLNPHPKGAF